MEAEDHEAVPDLEVIFRLHYSRITRLIAKITRDPGRAEELAVEVFLRWTGYQPEDDQAIGGWLSRTAIRLALDEVRRQDRRGKLARFAQSLRFLPNPEEIFCSQDQRGKVTQVLAKLKPRDAEILMLRAEGMTYQELGAALSLNAASVGKLLSRAQHAFRKEYLKRHGKADGSGDC